MLKWSPSQGPEISGGILSFLLICGRGIYFGTGPLVTVLMSTLPSLDVLKVIHHFCGRDGGFGARTITGVQVPSSESVGEMK
jgi:hypothetical protein